MITRALLALGAALVAAPTPAQTYPSKPIRYIVGFTPGTATDIVARMVGAKLTERWGQQVIAKLNTEVNTIIASPETRERLLGLGGTVVGGEPAALTMRMRAEREQVIQVVKRIEARDAAAAKR